MTNQVDVAIVGAGLIGSALAVALKASGYSTLLIDAKPFNQFVAAHADSRTLALSPASQRILDQLSIWPTLAEAAIPIQSIDISEQARLGRTRLNVAQDGTLGFVVAIDTLNAALQQGVDKHTVLAPATVVGFDRQTHALTIDTAQGQQVYHPTIVVAADGSDSSLRAFSSLTVNSKQYPHHALVANIDLARPHQGAAHERFTPHGPLAMLPMLGQRATMIWTLNLAQAQQLQAMDDKHFLQRLQQAFGYKLGRLTNVGKRHMYPLRQLIMPQRVDWPMVFVGNAAQTLHPVAGQGFNLGLRDVATLTQCIQQYGLTQTMFSEYQALRNYDQRSITWFTDTLVTLFNLSLPGLSHCRALGLVAFDQMTPIRNTMLNHMRGFAGQVPQLACKA